MRVILALFVLLLFLSPIYAEYHKVSVPLTSNSGNTLTGTVSWEVRERSSDSFKPFTCDKNDPITINPGETITAVCESDNFPSGNSGPHEVKASFRGESASKSYGQAKGAEGCKAANGECRLALDCGKDVEAKDISCGIAQKCCVTNTKLTIKSDCSSYKTKEECTGSCEWIKEGGLLWGLIGATEKCVSRPLCTNELGYVCIPSGGNLEHDSADYCDLSSNKRRDGVADCPGRCCLKDVSCDSCEACYNALLLAPEGAVVTLTRDISFSGTECIRVLPIDRQLRTTFDCAGHSITGSSKAGDGSWSVGIALTQDENFVIKGCRFKDVVVGINVYSSTLGGTIEGNDLGDSALSIESSNKVHVIDNVFCGELNLFYAFDTTFERNKCEYPECEESCNGPRVSSVRISPSEVTLKVGEKQQFEAIPLDKEGNPLSGYTFSWMVGDSNVGILDVNGLLSARNEGETEVSADVRDTKYGYFTGTAKVKVIPN